MIGPDWEPDPVDGLVGPRTKEYMIFVMNDKEFNFHNCVLFPNG